MTDEDPNKKECNEMPVMRKRTDLDHDEEKDEKNEQEQVIPGGRDSSTPSSKYWHRCVIDTTYTTCFLTNI